MDDRPDQPADTDRDDDAPRAGAAAGLGGDDGRGSEYRAEASMGEGVEHLQTAARQLIAAARTFLDIAEEVVGDKVAVASVADLLGSVSQVVSRAATQVQTQAAGGDDDAGDGAEPRVQHIKVT